MPFFLCLTLSLSLSLSPFFLKGPPHKGTVSPAAQPAASYCVAPFELIMFRRLVVIGGEGRGWLDSFVSCQPGSNLVRAICLYPEEGWRLHSTAALVLSLSACQPAPLPLSLSLTYSHSLSLSLPLSLPLAARLSALLHSTPRGPALCLPCQLNGVCQVCQYDWFLWFCQLSCMKKLDNLIWRGKGRKGVLLSVHCWRSVIVAG